MALLCCAAKYMSRVVGAEGAISAKVFIYRHSSDAREKKLTRKLKMKLGAQLCRLSAAAAARWRRLAAASRKLDSLAFAIAAAHHPSISLASKAANERRRRRLGAPSSRKISASTSAEKRQYLCFVGLYLADEELYCSIEIFDILESVRCRHAETSARLGI